MPQVYHHPHGRIIPERVALAGDFDGKAHRVSDAGELVREFDPFVIAAGHRCVRRDIAEFQQVIFTDDRRQGVERPESGGNTGGGSRPAVVAQGKIEPQPVAWIGNAIGGCDGIMIKYKRPDGCKARIYAVRPGWRTT